MGSEKINRRSFGIGSLGLALVVPFASEQSGFGQDDELVRGPTEAEFERDYPAPSFKPKWAKPQINRLMAQDFVIYAHSDLEMVKKLHQREPNLLNATLDWGNGDWETALGGSSHMGRKDIVNYLLAQGARMDIFCATMMGMLEVVQSMLTLQPALIDARGPHGFNLHFHAQVGGDEAKPVLDYLQSIKERELRPVPFLKNRKSSSGSGKGDSEKSTGK